MVPTVCPVCEHSPLNKDDCKAYNSLRTTVRVFLKSAEKKHKISLEKSEKSDNAPLNISTNAPLTTPTETTPSTPFQTIAPFQPSPTAKDGDCVEPGENAEGTMKLPDGENVWIREFPNRLVPDIP